MGDTYAELNRELCEFIAKQHLFFVASSPTALTGHLNISPKGLDTFRILGPRKIAYLDLTGSGIETVAHLRDNGRLTIMFCAFEGAPLILRLHGRGSVIEPGEPYWDDLIPQFPSYPGTRSIICMDIDRISDSCGWGVPRFDFKGERTQLIDFARRKGPEGIIAYKSENNSSSIDGLKGIEDAKNIKTEVE